EATEGCPCKLGRFACRQVNEVQSLAQRFGIRPPSAWVQDKAPDRPRLRYHLGLRAGCNVPELDTHENAVDAGYARASNLSAIRGNGESMGRAGTAGEDDHACSEVREVALDTGAVECGGSTPHLIVLHSPDKARPTQGDAKAIQSGVEPPHSTALPAVRRS